MKGIKKTADCIRNSQNCKCYAYCRSCKRGLEAKTARESSRRLFLKGARSEHIANRTSNRATRASKNILLSKQFCCFTISGTVWTMRSFTHRSFSLQAWIKNASLEAAKPRRLGAARGNARSDPPPLPYGKRWRVESKAQVRNCKSQICRSQTPI